MREFLFKGLDAVSKEWRTGNLRMCVDFTGNPAAEIEVNNKLYKVIPGTVCQFIGQRDWYHKPIFVGDILQKPDGSLAIVRETVNGWGLFKLVKNGAVGHHTSFTYIHTYKIIGNIRDDPQNRPAVE